MTTIGTLTKRVDGPEEVLSGAIETLQMQLEIILRPTGAVDDGPHPSYTAYAKAPSGGFAEVGAGWCKTLKSPDRFGEVFISLTLDDPSFPHPLNVAAFKDGEDSYRITWRRRQTQAPAA